MITRSLRSLAQMCQGELINITVNPEVSGVYINTREYGGEEIFVPIVGQNFDGHDYVSAAFEQGARVALFQKDHDYQSIERPLILVEDTTKALGDLARSFRKQLEAKVIAITGSNGKTSMKDILSHLLTPYFEVTKTLGNFNNEIGLPRTILSGDDETNLFVLEMGMSALGEIEYLQSIAHSDVAVITSIGKAHLADLGSVENIIEAKLEILKHLNPAGTLIVHGDHEGLMARINEINPDVKMITYGHLPHNDVVISEVYQFKDRIVFHCEALSDEPISVPLLGKHQALNTTGALLAARVLLHVDVSALVERLETLELTSHRNEVVYINDSIIIDDSYKSNPEALKLSLELLSQYPSDGRKVAVLGDMLDLGEDEVAYHQEISRLIASLDIDRVYTYGRLADHFHDNHHKIGAHFDDLDDLYQAVSVWLDQPSVILFKAANSNRLFDVVNRLKDIKKEG